MTVTITPDQARARATVAAMTPLVDLREWERLKRLFAERLVLDYTSLWGGEPQEVSRDELIAQWQAMLLGFDATMHELGPVSVSVVGDEATADAPVTGSHPLAGEAWVVSGRYHARLERSGATWSITALTYANEDERGERALTEKAKSRLSSQG
jgi:hypothetical protein